MDSGEPQEAPQEAPQERRQSGGGLITIETWREVYGDRASEVRINEDNGDQPLAISSDGDSGNTEEKES
ncbi:hypothetical protein E1189_03930 [Sansalvadorimonas verongulae]|nr:hypothetical protein [Sansalvadorimonas verongulae]